MYFVEKTGAGLTLRNRALNGPAPIEAVRRLLYEPGFKLAAGRVADVYRRYDTPQRLETALAELTDHPAGNPRRHIPQP